MKMVLQHQSRIEYNEKTKLYSGYATYSTDMSVNYVSYLEAKETIKSELSRQGEFKIIEMSIDGNVMQWGCTVHYTKAVKIPLDIGIDLDDIELTEDEVTKY